MRIAGQRVIAVRLQTSLTYPSGNGLVPIYFQPILGGPRNLRGFRQYRFYDNNLIVANVEYRWEAFSGLYMAVFFDAGKVTPKRSQINFHNLEASAGFGLRFKLRGETFMRIETGFSHEGVRVWLRFGEIFRDRW